MDRVVIVTKATRLEDLVREHMTEGTAQFVLSSRGQSIGPYVAEDTAYQHALAEVRRQIPNDLSVTTVSREHLANFLFREKDLIIICGPDGLFANAAKYIGDQVVLTVNPDPKSIAGVLMLFAPSDVGKIIADIREGRAMFEKLPFLKASIDNEKVLWGINDLFIGRKDQVSARYTLTHGSRTERHSSSGIIVSTGVGSSGWLRSIAAMVVGLTGRDTPHALQTLPSATSTELVFVVREPFPSPTTKVGMVSGHVIPDHPLTVISEMPHGGYLFSDGVIEKAIEWNAGSTVVVSVGERYIQRVVP